MNEYVLSWLSNDDFPLKKEYLAVREYMLKLQDKKNIVGNDLFDLFQ